MLVSATMVAAVAAATAAFEAFQAEDAARELAPSKKPTQPKTSLTMTVRTARRYLEAKSMNRTLTTTTWTTRKRHPMRHLRPTTS